MHAHLAEAFSDKAFYAKLLFVRNASDIFREFLSLFQSSEPLLHCVFDEMVALVHQLCGCFMKMDSYNSDWKECALSAASVICKLEVKDGDMRRY